MAARKHQRQDIHSNQAGLLLQLLVATSVMAHLWSTFLKDPPQLGLEVELQHASMHTIYCQNTMEQHGLSFQWQRLFVCTATVP